MSCRSVDALWRELEGRQPLVCLGLAPQLERAPQELTPFLCAILLDPLLDARKRCRSIGVWKNHSISVEDASTPSCSLLDSAHRLKPSHLRPV
jgi:hypothetical protein